MNDSASETSMAGCFLSAFRNLAGPGLLLALGTANLMNRVPAGSAFDLAFLAVSVAVLISGILYRPPSPQERKPGDTAGLSRAAYVIGVLVVTVAFWVVTHFVLGRAS